MTLVSTSDNPAVKDGQLATVAEAALQTIKEEPMSKLRSI
jgi:hypothetical protein